MSAICIVAAEHDSAARARSMLTRLAGSTQKPTLLTPTPTLSIGHCDHFRLSSRRPLKPLNDGLIVAIDGDIFDEAGPASEPQRLVGDLYRRDTLEEIAALNGSFSLAIVDPQKQRVVLASDRFGTRPLYIWHGPRGLAVSTRLHALLLDDRLSRKVSLQGLVEIIALQRPLADHTLYADVFSLIGGDLVTWEAGQVTRRRTWRPAWRAADHGIEEAAEQLAAGLRRAVSIRLQDSSNPGLLLSGGLDSRLVLAAATAEGKTIECVTATARENLELRIAREVATRAGQRFRSYVMAPEAITKPYDAAAVAVDGLYPAPINLFGLWPRLAETHDLLLHGYGLDYTLRGLYLPKRKFLGATWPYLRHVANGGVDSVIANMTIGDRSASWRQAIPAGSATDWSARLRQAISEVIDSCDPRSPYDAWDTLAIAPQSRHYTSSALIGMGAYLDQRLVSFDRRLSDLYLSVRPEWRAGDALASRALKLLSPSLASVPNANSNLPAGMPAGLQVALIVGRAAWRRLRSSPRRSLQSTFTDGSWLSHQALFRTDATLRDRLKQLPNSSAMREIGLFSHAGLARVVDEHLSGRSNHVKFLHTLTSLDAWFQQHPYSGVA